MTRGIGMDRLALLANEMIEHEKGVPARVGHFLKVHNFAKTIGELEQLPPDTLYVLEAAALVHDIGIKPSLEKYGSSAGPLQEKEGGPAAREMLGKLGFPQNVIDRVACLVERHHTYTNVDGLDCQILLEADFLVNMLEEGMSRQAIESACEKVFKTRYGKRFCELQYLA
jgi:HD superfamily phosphodiesterase